ncbi:OmpA family protein [Aurantiacibacter spongiae]|uniref:OmpA family protein n=1 Tax=Aurantiacibacter spongiae TaxID=2488860 RepID=A0A3N5CT03_9SPHN|nr:OmpA family protein [Aurantiacibacter spongiae]RPF72294.1 OmpA family protein [Aurantiacibacter spongiae]
MSLLRQPHVVIPLGALLVIALAWLGGNAGAPALGARLSDQARTTIASAGGGGQVEARFLSPNGFDSRHPVLVGGSGLDEDVRARIARSVAAIPGVGGVRWADGDARAAAGERVFRPMHCQEDVRSLLRARTIRFEESSVRIDAASYSLIDEVATALRPCLGAIIQITGHTDSSGPEAGNIELSSERANAVRRALIARGIPADGLRARGIGSRRPVEGLDPTDPANRRIEFSVLATEAISPTPVDTPAAR